MKAFRRDMELVSACSSVDDIEGLFAFSNKKKNHQKNIKTKTIDTHMQEFTDCFY